MRICFNAPSLCFAEFGLCKAVLCIAFVEFALKMPFFFVYIIRPNTLDIFASHSGEDVVV